jgi:hypothetical protein
MNTSPNANYYGNIQLLNDLHNYFPEILYGTRFENDGLVRYIREVVSQRFNLFSSAQNTYSQNHQQVYRIATASAPINTMYMDEQHISPTNIMSGVLGGLREGINIPVNVNGFVNLLQSMLDSSNVSPITEDENHNLTNLQPVNVRPTMNQIENASSIVELTSSQSICAICQEHMLPNQTIRRLNQCRHLFHNSCIMTAFETSVRCPNCRHDIRN